MEFVAGRLTVYLRHSFINYFIKIVPSYVKKNNIVNRQPSEPEDKGCPLLGSCKSHKISDE